jgi:hypothetical protein
MNKVVTNAVAALAFVGVAGFGMVACGSDQDYDNVQYVYVHGYYDSHHHYHTYSTPHRVTKNYYNHHKSSYPKPYKTSTTKVPRTTGGTVNKPGHPAPKRFGTTTNRKSGSYKSSGGSRKR